MRSGSTKTHQRPKCEVSKRFKSPGGSSSPAHPLERRGLPHSLSCQADGRKRRNTSRKISTGSRNLLRFMPSPASPNSNSHSSDLPSYLHSPYFTSTFLFSPLPPASPRLCTFSDTFFFCHTHAHPAPCGPAILLILLYAYTYAK